MSAPETHLTLSPECSNCISHRPDSSRRPTQVNANELKGCPKCFSIGVTVLYCNATCQKEAWPHHKVFCGKPRQLPSYQRPTAQLLSTSPKVLRQLALLEQPTNKYDYYFIPDDSEDIAPIGVTVEDPVLAKEFRECLFTVLTGQYGNALDALMANISLTKPGAPDVIKNLMGLVFTQSKRHGHALGMVHGLARAVADDGRVFALDAWKKQLEEEHGFPIDMNPLSAAGGADGSSDA